MNDFIIDYIFLIDFCIVLTFHDLGNTFWNIEDGKIIDVYPTINIQHRIGKLSSKLNNKPHYHTTMVFETCTFFVFEVFR